MKKTSEIKRLIDFMGGVRKFAGAMEVSTQAVYGWIDAGEIPPRRAIEVEEMTDGRFKAADLIKGV